MPRDAHEIDTYSYWCALWRQGVARHPIRAQRQKPYGFLKLEAICSYCDRRKRKCGASGYLFDLQVGEEDVNLQVAKPAESARLQKQSMERESPTERWGTVLLLLIVALLTAAILWDCIHRPLFYDELFTFYVARLDTLGAVWRALLSGADNHAPLEYLLCHVTMKMFGESAIVLRLPSMIAYLLAIAGYYRFVRNAFGASQALIALLASVMCYHEMLFCARPYGLLMGVCAGLLVCWQNARSNQYRIASLICIALLSFLAPLLHYYGALLVLPIVGAEIRRTQLSGRIDRAIWLSCAFVILPLPILWPFIVSARAYSHGFWTKALTGDANIVLVYLFLLWRLMICFLIAGAVWPFAKIVARRQRRTQPARVASPEFVAGLVLILSPIIVYIIAITITNASSTVYSLQAGFGAGIVLAAWVETRWIVKRSLALSLSLFLVPLLCDICSGTDPLYLPPTMRFIAAHAFRLQTSEPPTIAGTRAEAELALAMSRGRHLPVVFASPTQFMRAVYYGGEAGRTFIYLSDREIALSLLKFDTVDRGLSQLGPFAHLQVLDYSEFISTHNEFLVVTLPANNREEQIMTWLPTRLKSEHAKCEVLNPGSPEVAEITLKDVTRKGD